MRANYNKGLLAVSTAAGGEKQAMSLMQLMSAVAGGGMGGSSGYQEHGDLGGALGGGVGGAGGALGGATLGGLLARAGQAHNPMEATRPLRGHAALLPLMMAITGGVGGARLGGQAGHGIQEHFQGE